MGLKNSEGGTGPVKTISEPCPENDYLGDHAELILSSLFRLTGRHLVEPDLAGPDRYRRLYEAPFCVVSHTTDADPVFNYGNQTALMRFEMTWEEFTRLPSRLSAEKAVQDERDRLLEKVARYGYIDDYRGVRVSASGKRFQVEDAVVWNLIDENGAYRGQAAALFAWTDL